MEELSKNLEKEKLEDLYNTYIKIKILIDELNNNKKELPPKEEL